MLAWVAAGSKEAKQNLMAAAASAYPEEFCGWGPRSAKQMVCWAVRMEDLGTPIAAAQQAAKALGLKFKRRDQAV